MLGKSIKIHKVKNFTLFPKNQQKSTRDPPDQNSGPIVDSDYQWPHNFIYVISFIIRGQIDFHNSYSYFSHTWDRITLHTPSHMILLLSNHSNRCTTIDQGCITTCTRISVITMNVKISTRKILNNYQHCFKMIRVPQLQLQ